MPLPGEGAPMGAEEPDLTHYEEAADRHAGVVDERAAAAAEAASWQKEWDETLDEVQYWGPYVAGAYAKARERAGDKTVTPYDDNGEPARMSRAERRAYELQPDVLIVDIVRRGRSLRNLIRDNVEERVALAGWVISERTYPNPNEPEVAEESSEETADEPQRPLRRAHRGNLDDLEPDEPEDSDEPDDEPEEQAKTNELTELVVMMQDGKVVRFEGANPTPKAPGHPLRFGRARPDKALLKEDKDEYARQSELLKEYLEDNADHFAQPDEMEFVAILHSDTIAEVDLGEKGAPSYLEAGVVYDGLVNFLHARRLVRSAAPETQASAEA